MAYRANPLKDMRKLVDIPGEDLCALCLPLETELKLRRIHYQRQLCHLKGMHVMRIFVACRDLCIARTILQSLKFHQGAA